MRKFKAYNKLVHDNLELKAALEAEGFFDSENNETYICEVCGHIHRGKKAPKICPLCKARQEYFKKASGDITTE